jgi:hypothetical protein
MRKIIIAIIITFVVLMAWIIFLEKILGGSIGGGI